jgi:uncharacterized protein YjbI with pentapeptide repeats
MGHDIDFSDANLTRAALQDFAFDDADFHQALVPQGIPKEDPSGVSHGDFEDSTCALRRIRAPLG